MDENSSSMPNVTSAIIVPKNSGSSFFTAVSIKNFLLLTKELADSSDIRVIEILPCQLKRVIIPKNISKIYIGDLGQKNCEPAQLNDFFKRNNEKIMLWANNDPIVGNLFGEDKRIFFHKAPSTTELLNKLWGDKIVKPEWAVAANHLENPIKNPRNEIASQYKEIMHIPDDSIESKLYLIDAKKIISQHLIEGKIDWYKVNELLKRN